jgi:hypothetical protein
MQPVMVYKEFSCLLLQVSVLSLADFMYSSSGLFPWLTAGMLKVRTRWVVSSLVGAAGRWFLALAVASTVGAREEVSANDFSNKGP